MNKQDFDKRILKKPSCYGFYNTDCDFNDSIREDAELNYEGLFIDERITLFIYAHTKEGLVLFKRAIAKEFGLTEYKVAQWAKKIKGIEVVTCWDESTGLISGRGYQFNFDKITEKP